MNKYQFMDFMDTHVPNTAYNGLTWWGTYNNEEVCILAFYSPKSGEWDVYTGVGDTTPVRNDDLCLYVKEWALTFAHKYVELALGSYVKTISSNESEDQILWRIINELEFSPSLRNLGPDRRHLVSDFVTSISETLNSSK